MGKDMKKGRRHKDGKKQNERRKEGTMDGNEGRKERKQCRKDRWTAMKRGKKENRNDMTGVERIIERRMEG
jgi:hypothetical protein